MPSHFFNAEFPDCTECIGLHHLIFTEFIGLFHHFPESAVHQHLLEPRNLQGFYVL